jgi:type I restriction enzyme S subunit
MKMIPELRFPEFENEGEWDAKELNELGELINGLTYSPDDVRDKGLLVLRSSNIQNGRIELNDCVYVREDIKGANLTEPKDILICVRNGSKNLIGKNAIIPKGLPLVTHGAFMTVFRAINPEFVFQLFQTDYYDTQVKADLGATINSINGKNFLKYEFPVPENPQEQQKIASCLSSLDEVIAAHSQKLALLKDHKKGLMQNLFPQEGKKVPKVRFKEFGSDGEWVGKKLGEVFSIFQGFAFSSEASVSNGTRWLKIADVGIQQMKNDSPSYLPISFQEEYERFLVKKGDFVLALTRPILNMELKIAQVDDTFNNALLNQRVGKIVSNNHTSFVYYLLQTNEMVYSINNNIAGNEPPNLSFQQIENILIYIPESREEQQKIASCLSSLDALITAQAEKIEQLKMHKKGLMQGLFPKIND